MAQPVCPHCHLPPILPEVCTLEINAILEQRIARDAELFEAGRQHGLTHRELSTPNLRSGPA